MGIELKICPHCGTEGILIMADGRCPHCKKSLLEAEEQLIDLQSALTETKRPGLQSSPGGAKDSLREGLSPAREAEVSTDAADRSREPEIKKNSGCADSGETQPHLEMVAVSEVKPSPNKRSAPANAEGTYTSTNHINQQNHNGITSVKATTTILFSALARWASYGLMVLSTANIGFSRVVKDWNAYRIPGDMSASLNSLRILLVLAFLASVTTLASLKWSRSLVLRYAATGFAILAMIVSSVLLWDAYTVNSEDWRLMSIFSMPVVVCAGFQVLGLWMSKQE